MRHDMPEEKFVFFEVLDEETKALMREAKEMLRTLEPILFNELSSNFLD